MVDKLALWTSNRGLDFSSTKTMAMHFCRSRLCHRNLSITLNGSKLSTPSTIKYLGLHFDQTLSFKPHIAEIKKSCLIRMNLLRKLAHTSYGADTISLLRLYRALIKSKCDYGAPIYSAATKTDLNSLNIIHHKALRLATGVFPTTACLNLYFLSNEYPPDLHRQLIFLRFLVRTLKKERTLFHPDALNRHKTYYKKRFTPRLESALEILKLDSSTLSDPKAIRLLQDATASEWSNRWKSQPPMRQLLSIFPTPNPFLLSSGSRKHDIILHRLLTGHSRLTHSYIFSKSLPPICSTCHYPLTIPHLLLECPILSSLRQHLPPNPTLKTFFELTPPALIITHLRNTELYSLI